MNADWIYLSRVQFKQDCLVQTLRGSPNGVHSERQHIATKSVTIALDPVTQLIRLQGYGNTKYSHASGMIECDELHGEAMAASARLKQAKATGQPLNGQDAALVDAAIGAGINTDAKK